MKKYYKILGLESSATFDEVKNKYNELSKEFDPSKQTEDLKDFFISEQKKIDNAFEKISSSNLKEASISNKNNDENINDNLNSEEKIVDNHEYDSDSNSEENSLDIYNNLSADDLKESKQILINNILLVVIAVGIWGLFMQNMGIFVPNDDYTQKVRVVNTVDTEVQNSVNVNGSLDIDNIVDINIKKVNGYKTKTYNKGHLGVSDR